MLLGLLIKSYLFAPLSSWSTACPLLLKSNPVSALGPLHSQEDSSLLGIQTPRNEAPSWVLTPAYLSAQLFSFPPMLSVVKLTSLSALDPTTVPFQSELGSENIIFLFFYHLKL